MKQIITIFALLIFSLSYSQVDYDTQIQPIFDTNCITCHVGAAAYTGGLDLTSYDELMEGGYTFGGVIYTGLLEEYITTGYMPAYGSGNTLSSEEIDLIVQWISEGSNSSSGEEGCTEGGALYAIGDELFLSDECSYITCEGNNSWSDTMVSESCCELSGGELVPSGWQGSDTDWNWCNSCWCDNGGLSCTEMDCGEQGCWEENEWYCIGCEYFIDECTYLECESNDNWSSSITIDDCGDCISDIDNDGICEDDCEEMQYMVVDCECSFFNPLTYTIFFTTVDEENCLTIDDCACECNNDINENGICDEEEEVVGEGCWEENEFYAIGTEMWIDECTYFECLFEGLWSEIMTIDDCNGCDVIAYIIVDCMECPAGQTMIFWEEFDEETCTLYEMCDCVEQTGEGCWEEGVYYCIGCELSIDDCNYIECEGDNNWSDTITIDDCNEGCPCINPDWIDPFAICTMIYQPVTGCDGVIYSNSCLAQAAGVTAWIDVTSLEIVTLEWDCDTEIECVAELDPNCAFMMVWDPVCGCDGVTYSNSGEAACNNIFEYTEGECGGEEGCYAPDGSFCYIGCEVFLDDCSYIECEGANNWSDVVTIEGCGEDIEGCMDEEACNYMPSATIACEECCVYDGDPECEDCGTVLDFENYTDNENFSETYYAPDGLIITINFSGSTEVCCDHIYVNGVEYDGVLDGIVIGDEVLNIEWVSDFSVNSLSGYGWSAELICEEPIFGCTQPYAENYNPDANTDDGSCELDCEYLLTYESYIDLNYDNSISNYYCNYYVTNGTYTIEQAEGYGYNCDCVIMGCTDSEALNYDETAFVDDCSCVYEEACTSVSVTAGIIPTEISWEIENENGDIILEGGAPYCGNFCFEDGCYSIHMYDTWGDGWNNAVLSINEYDYTLTTGTYGISPFGYNNDDCIIEGCTNSFADNYNPDANYDDGSCEYGCEYLLTYESYQELGFDNSVSNYYCGYYVELAYYTVDEMENMGYNCDCVIVGCTDEEATNYDEEAFVDDCSCVYENDCPAISFNTTDSSLGWQIMSVEGDVILEYNYNSSNEIGSYCGNYCFEDGCYIINMSSMWGGGWYQTTLDIGEESFPFPTGYEGMAAFAYNTEIDCEIGCTDPEASNYNPNAILDDGSCVLFGCTITIACNYNPDATAFDGSCYYCYMDDCDTYPSDFYDCDGGCFDEDDDGVCDWDEISGCMDEEACNYDPNATESGSCEYPEEYYDCNGICINDADGDEVCNELDNCPLVYNPNQEDVNNDGIGDACDGVGLDEDHEFQWSVYPNPFKNYTTVKFTNQTNKEFIIRVISLSGKVVYNETTINSEHRINNAFSSGYYIVELKSKNTIVRQTLMIE